MKGRRAMAVVLAVGGVACAVAAHLLETSPERRNSPDLARLIGQAVAREFSDVDSAREAGERAWREAIAAFDDLHTAMRREAGGGKRTGAGFSSRVSLISVVRLDVQVESHADIVVQVSAGDGAGGHDAFWETELTGAAHSLTRGPARVRFRRPHLSTILTCVVYVHEDSSELRVNVTTHTPGTRGGGAAMRAVLDASTGIVGGATPKVTAISRPIDFGAAPLEIIRIEGSRPPTVVTVGGTSPATR